MSKIAIKGHPTRGKEVIELLEMLGGVDWHGFAGNRLDSAYYISDSKAILFDDTYDIVFEDGIKEFITFTLEEFIEKFPYKVGDRVNSPCKGCIKTITSMEWDTCRNTVTYKLDNRIYTNIDQLNVVNDLQPHKEDVSMEVNKLFGTVNNPVETKPYTVSLKDGKVIDNSIDTSQFMQIGKTVAVCFNTENYADEVELQLGDYEIVVRDGKTYAALKKPKYQTT